MRVKLNSKKSLIMGALIVFLTFLGVFIFNRYSFEVQLKKNINILTENLVWVNSFKISGYNKQQVEFTVNDQFNDATYKEVVDLLRRTYVILVSELGVNSAYDKDTLGAKFAKDAYKSYESITVSILINGMEYICDYDTPSFTGVRVIKGQETTDDSINAPQGVKSSSVDFLRQLKKTTYNEINIYNCNFPNNNTKCLYVMFDDNFYKASLENKYIALRKLYSDYESFLSSDNSLSGHELWVFNKNSDKIIFKITQVKKMDSVTCIESFGGHWFGEVSYIPLFHLDNNTKQLAEYDNPTLYIGEGLGKDRWDFDYDQFLNDYNEQKSNEGSGAFSIQNVSEDEKGFAWAVAQEEVRSRLKSPSSASFPTYNHATIEKNDNVFEVTGYVDADNALGATLKVDFVVTFEKTGSELYKLINVEIME